MSSVTDKVPLIVEGHEILISNPNKPLWPKIKKVDYLQKLVQIAPYLLRYCKNRYLTTIRYPHGYGDKTYFYQKNCPEPRPSFVKTAKLHEINYVNLDSVATLLWLGNLACLEFHPSFHYIDQSFPAEWVIDIDPSVENEPRLMDAVLCIGELLETLHIQSVPKTSGATGVQIVIPIIQKYSFDQLRKAGQFISEYLVHKYPNLFTIERLKKNRGHLIYIDYLQHWQGKTLAAPYTPRARELAPVSTPLHWHEVKKDLHPKDFNLLNIEERLKQEGDLIQKVKPQQLDHLLEHISN
ncbi:DNA polymerase domain-containing protein [Chengkuizengella axinellae]|uniref:DNA polymerase domain-containing protein n=1 Tax=Chengkuizengella axinellae TaxID=3064388 RepID=A0ABT9J5C2_9BACL|nr:DNA polymerase domain-containing protein [Chengkuizengella sp. 2205SS18-9]MDP5276662.1 DNA polymerase domain-containing protein [Chengkuizengella sp. 2205SS18-9]